MPGAAAGFLAAAVAAAVVVVLVFGLVGEFGALLAIEVRRAAPVAPEAGTRFFSSSETEGRDRCETVEEAVGGRLIAAAPVAGRAAGLPTALTVLVRVVEFAVGLVVPVPGAVGRRVAEGAVAVVRLAAVVLVGAFFTVVAFGEVVDTAGDVGSASDTGADSGTASVGASVAGADADASVGWTTSKLSASDMMGCVGNAVGSGREKKNWNYDGQQ